MWENLAKYCQEVYGVFIDWEERFFICPECAEPIYEDDWSVDELMELGGCCPVLPDSYDIVDCYPDCYERLFPHR